MLKDKGIAGMAEEKEASVFSPENTPQVDNSVMEGWQDMLELFADLTDMPVAVVFKQRTEGYEIFLSSETEGNPFERGDIVRFGTDFFVERILAEGKMTEIKADDSCESSIEANRGMKVCLGGPLRWPDGEVFGVLCAMTPETISFSDNHVRLMGMIQSLGEKDLGIIHKNLELEEKDSQFGELAERDSLTKLYNHNTIYEFLFVEIENAVRNGKQLTIGMVDVDGFKEINNLFGHKAGDIVLRDVADIMKSRFRGSDIIGRYGGDEFLAIFTNTSMENAFNVAERLRKEVETFEGSGFEVTISIGLTSLEGKCTPDELVQKAEEALMKAKQRGMNRVIDY